MFSQKTEIIIGDKKFDYEKLEMTLLLDFKDALEKVVEVGMYGMVKYGRDSWKTIEEGERRYKNALLRHLFSSSTQDTDDESGLEELAHVAWNALAILQLKLNNS